MDLLAVTALSVEVSAREVKLRSCLATLSSIALSQNDFYHYDLTHP